MLNDYLHTFVALLFLCQLVTISIYVSFRWRTSRKHLLTQYPQASFPNLYVRSEHEELQRLRYRQYLDNAVFIIGLSGLAFLLITQSDMQKMTQLMIISAAAQLIPIALSGYWCNQNSNIMRTRFPDRIRKTKLTRNSIDTQQVLYSAVAVFLFILTITTGYFLTNTINDQITLDKINNILWLNFVVFLIILLMYLKTVIGNRNDNFADPSESEQRVRGMRRHLAIMLCTFNLFMLYVLASTFFGFNHVYVSVITSLVVQSTILTTKEQYFPINPSAYK